MNYIIDCDQTKEIIKVTASFHLTREWKKEILFTVASRLSVSKYSRALIDTTNAISDSEESMVEALTLINYMRTLNFPPHAKIAFLHHEMTPPELYFVTLARADGFNIMCFQDDDTAIKWLQC